MASSKAAARTFSQLEHSISRLSLAVKPLFPHIGRFLLIITFLEDAVRVFTQWSEQLRYMAEYRSFSPIVSKAFLLYCMIGMVVGSVLAWASIRTPLACTLLASVIVLQTVGYGLFWHASFMLRNISLIGGILLLLAESLKRKSKHSGTVLPGLPRIHKFEHGTYLTLLGRVLLIFLFGSFIFGNIELSFVRITLAVLSLISCAMVIVGFKAKYSAMFLVSFLCISNIVVNQWWNRSSTAIERDFLRYDFFQTLSIIGGFLLLVKDGPGELSLDEKNKLH